MTSAGTVTVNVEGRDVNLVNLLTQLEARLRQTDQAGIRLSATTAGPFTAAQSRAANSALAEASAIARVAATMGQKTQATHILTTALSQNTAAGDRNVASITAQISQLQQASGATRSFATTMQGLTSVVGAFGVSLGAAAFVRGAVDLAQLGAAAEQTRTRFDQLAKTAGTTGDAMLAALQKFSAGTISDQALQLAAMKASLLGVATSAEQLGPLLAIARDRAQQMGISVEFAFDSLVTGLGRGSRLILDNVGVIVKAADANRAYAAQIGKSVDALTEQEQKQALINEVVRQGNETIATTGGAVAGSAADYQKMGAAAENAKVAVGSLVSQLLKIPTRVVTEIIVKGTEGLSALANADAQLEATRVRLLEVSGSFDAYGQKLSFVNQQLAPFGASLAGLTQQQFTFAQSLISSGTSAADASAKVQQYASVIQAGTLANTDWGRSSADAVNQLLALSATTSGNAAAVENLSQSYLSGNISAATFSQAVAQLATMQEVARQAAAEEARENRLLAGAHVEAANAADQASAAEQVAAVNTQILTVEKGRLTQAAQIAANALLAAGDAGAATAARLANSSNQVEVLTAAYYRLAAAQRAAAVDLTAGNPERGGDAIARSMSGAAASQRFLAAQTDAATAAQRQQTLAVGTHAQKVGVLQGEYERLSKIYGATSEQAIGAQTKLIQAQQAGAKAAKGAGAVKLSDQQKLNNTLLSDQEKYLDQVEAAEREHGKRILDIEKEYQKKQLEQQKSNELSKRASEIDFLKALTSSELNTTKAGREELARIDAAYYADFDAAQKAAAAGNLKQSEELVAQAKHRADVELEYAEKIAEAQKNKDAGEVARLTALREKERQLLDEQQKQILAGGDPNAEARNAALSEEEQRYAEQQDKMGAASDAATERKVNNALRDGKAVDAVTAKLREQEAVYNRIGGVPGATGAPTPPTPNAALPTPTAQGTTDTLSAALSALRDATAAVERAVVAAGDKVAGAVGRIGAQRLTGA